MNQIISKLKNLTGLLAVLLCLLTLPMAAQASEKLLTFEVEPKQLSGAGSDDCEEEEEDDGE